MSSSWFRKGLRSALLPMLATGAQVSLGPGCAGNPVLPRTNDGRDGGDVSCSVAAPISCPAPALRYADISNSIAQYCAGPCHSGIPDGPWPLTSYEHVADWADVIRTELLGCTMPPADSGIALPSADQAAILAWIRCGFPE